MNDRKDSRALVSHAAEWVRARWSLPPTVGMVLGTGAGEVADEIDADVRLPYQDVPGFAYSTAIGHVGELVCGRWRGVPIIAMQGRCHLYEGYSVSQAALPILVMARLGVQRLLVSNAAGGVNPRFAVGDLMLINSHVNLLFRGGGGRIGVVGDREVLGQPGGCQADSPPGNGPVFRPVELYDRGLIDLGWAAARRLGIAAHRGIYVGLLGPNYETRAEYRMIRRIGGDAVGMSTIPEIITAAQCGIPALAISIITNVANPDCLEKTSGHKVVAAGIRAAEQLRNLFAEVIECTRSRVGLV